MVVDNCIALPAAALKQRGCRSARTGSTRLASQHQKTCLESLASSCDVCSFFFHSSFFFFCILHDWLPAVVEAASCVFPFLPMMRSPFPFLAFFSGLPHLYTHMLFCSRTCCKQPYSSRTAARSTQEAQEVHQWQPLYHLLRHHSTHCTLVAWPTTFRSTKHTPTIELQRPPVPLRRLCYVLLLLYHFKANKNRVLLTRNAD